MTHETGAIVVLGSPNDDRGVLSSIAVERCERALAEYRRHPEYRILPTGGWGAHFNTTDKPHGHYVRQYLVARGVPESAFLECAESANTPEDAARTRPIVNRHGIDRLLVVTSDFHLARARFVFEHEFPDKGLAFSACSTRLPEDDLERRRAHEAQALRRLQGG